jgi:pimeloyl-ACP methyl ester carboxylesterase
MEGPHHRILAFERHGNPGLKRWHVYIEGDGFAYRAKDRLSPDSTPFILTALQLATQDPFPNVLYLGRPCQYKTLTSDPSCHWGAWMWEHSDHRWWTHHRFYPEVIENYRVLLKSLAGQELVLYGYSGGANIALLLATRVPGVVRVETIAGNLDHSSLHEHHKVPKMSDNNLNAWDERLLLRGIPQIHYFGTRDTVVPPSMGKRWMEGQAPLSTIEVHSVDANHWDGWAKRWRELSRP